MKLFEMKPLFVQRVPENLDDGMLYVCLSCDVVIHKCACGCGKKVILPIAPDCWKLEYDGEITLSPSIGNFQYECKSHYFIRNGKVIWVESPQKKLKNKKRHKKKSLFEKLKKQF